MRGQLLAGDGVGEALEHSREAGQFESPVPAREGAEVRVVSASPVEPAEVHVEAEQTAEYTYPGWFYLHSGWV